MLLCACKIKALSLIASGNHLQAYLDLEMLECVWEDVIVMLSSLYQSIDQSPLVTFFASLAIITLTIRTLRWDNQTTTKLKKDIPLKNNNRDGLIPTFLSEILEGNIFLESETVIVIATDWPDLDLFSGIHKYFYCSHGHCNWPIN